MQVFKLTNKLQIKNIQATIISLIVFIFMSVLMGLIAIPNEVNSFELEKVNMGIINEDGESEATTSLLKALEPLSNGQREIDMTREELQDAMFYSEVTYVLIIPKGYSDALTSGNPIPTEKMVNSEYNSVSIDTMINKFVSTYLTYKNNTKLTDTQIFEKVMADMGKQAELEVVNNTKIDGTLVRFTVYCRFALMLFFAAIANIIINGSSIYRSKKLFARTSCSPINSKTTLWQIVLSCLMFISAVFVVWALVSMMIFGSAVFSARGLLMLLNVLVLLLPLTAMCILISATIKNQEVIIFLGNIFGIVMAFASGSFIDQQLLSTTLKVVGMMTPGWYFVENIDNITKLNLSSAMSGMFINMGIMLGFAVVMMLITIAINKYKKVDRF